MHQAFWEVVRTLGHQNRKGCEVGNWRSKMVLVKDEREVVYMAVLAGGGGQTDVLGTFFQFLAENFF